MVWFLRSGTPLEVMGVTILSLLLILASVFALIVNALILREVWTHSARGHTEKTSLQPRQRKKLDWFEVHAAFVIVGLLVDARQPLRPQECLEKRRPTV